MPEKPLVRAGAVGYDRSGRAVAAGSFLSPGTRVKSVSATLQALFLDRDGTLIEKRHYLSDPEDVVLIPGTREALRRARDSGVHLFLFSNQSGVGRGYFTMADVNRVNYRMLELLDLGDDLFSGVCIATERPDEPSRYRKPSPRFIEEMLEERGIATDAAWMLGDTPADWEAGLNAGVRVAAIAAGPTADAVRDRRLELGIAAYPSVQEWLATVLGTEL